MSQRELAAAAGTTQSTVARAESGARAPSLELMSRMFAATGHHLVVVDDEGKVLRPLHDLPGVHDLAGRRYPAHLDVYVGSVEGPWWHDQYGFQHPPDSFNLDPEMRAYRRAHSAWQIRKKRYLRDPEPEPPNPGVVRRRSIALDIHVPDHMRTMIAEERELGQRPDELTEGELDHLTALHLILDRAYDLLREREAAGRSDPGEGGKPAAAA